MSKKLIVILAVIAMVSFSVLGQSNPPRRGDNGNGNDGNNREQNHRHQVHNILEGTPFSFSGTVTDVGIAGNGLEVTTTEGTIIVKGLGPEGYWASLGMDKPEVGDQVSGNGYTVDYNGTEKNVLIDITVNGERIELRDSEGKPLWWGEGSREREHHRNWRGEGPKNWHKKILEGTPFSFEGDVISTCPGDSKFRGSGLELATATGNVTVKGLGPLGYWKELGFIKPVEGDTVKAEGYTVTFETEEATATINILMSIILADGTPVQLRDPETAAPLWRRKKS